MQPIHRNAIVFTLASAFLVALAYAEGLPVELDPEWGCYDPAPGHPTGAERSAFIASASVVAVKAENTFGVPAVALAAMAALESGYGWTRTAVFAKNFFGWKSAEGSKAAYHLACQPIASDPNAYYVRYATLEQSMLAVAARLRDSPNYRADTARYQADLANGVEPSLAAKLWVDAIAPRYNGDPAKYRRSLRRMMNDPTGPSDAVNPSTSLYRLAPKRPLNTKFSSLEESPAYLQVLAVAKNHLDPGVRYMDSCIDGSGAIDMAYGDYEGYPVKRCIYERGGLKALAYTLNPTAAQTAAWVAFACIRANAPDQAACARRLFWPSEPGAEGIFNSNNAQFPVAGSVVERGDEAGCIKSSTYYHLEFRHGVTVQLAGESTVCLEGERSIEKQEIDRGATVARYRNVARISALTAAEYQQATGKVISSGKPEHLEWARLNQLSHLTAFDDGVNSMLNVQAERLFGQHAVK